MSRTWCGQIALAIATMALHIVVSGSGSARADVIRDGHRSIQVNVDSFGRNRAGDAANEPSIAVDPGDPRRMAIGWRQFNTLQSEREAGWAYSRDGGHHWTFPGTLIPGAFGSDPVLDVTAEGVFFYVSIDMNELRLFRSLDGGMTWGNPYFTLPGLHDKPWIAVDRTGGPGHGHIYISEALASLRRSTDGGRTFERGVGGSNYYGTIAVDAFGRVFTCSMRSTNARYSNQVPTFEPMGFSSCGAQGSGINGIGLSAQPWIAADQGDGAFRGNLYTLRIFQVGGFIRKWVLAVLRTEDSGETWSDWVAVTDEPLPAFGESQWFPMLSVAPSGRVDIIWNDPRNNPYESDSELYYTYSHDGGRTWAANIPLSPSFDPHVGYPRLSSKLGDYYTMVSDNLGVNVAYAATFNGEQDVYFLRVGPWDCNGNETPDEQDTASGWSLDINANDIPDDCEVPQDADGNGRVNLFDYAAWQNCHGWADSRFSGHRAGGGRSGVVALTPGKGDAVDADPLCPRFDADANGHADLDDFAVFFEEFTRPQGPQRATGESPRRSLGNLGGMDGVRD